MRLKHFLSVFLTLLTLSVGNAWGAIASGTYELVTSASGLVAGEHYIIASGTSGTVYCIDNTNNANNRRTVSATVSNNQITVAANSTILTFTLGGSSGAWTFTTDNYLGTAGKLAATNSSNNRLGIVADPGNNGNWAITFTNTYVAKFVAQGNYTKKYIQYNYNSGSPIFNGYGSEGTPSTYIYRQQSCTPPATALSITSSSSATVGTPLSLTTNGGNGGSITWSVVNGTGTATLDGSTLTPTGAGTVTVTATQGVNDGKCGAAPSQTITITKAPATITLSEAGATSNVSGTHYGGDSYTLPSSTEASCGSKVLVGWSSVTVAETNTKPSSNYYDKGTSVTLAAGANTFYAVYAIESGSEKSTQTVNYGFESTDDATVWTITNIDSYSSAKASGSYSGKCSVSGTNIVSPNNITYNSKLSEPVSISFKTSKTGNTNASNYWKVQYSSNGSSYSDATDGAGPNHSALTNNTFTDAFEVDLSSYSNVYIRITHNGQSPATLIDDIVLKYKTISTTYSAYSTVCCSPLGQINGSVSLSQLSTPDPTKLKATWAMTSTTGIASYTLEVYNSSSNALVKTITNYTSGSEITGLTPCTSYYVKLYTVSSGTVGNVTYCEGGLISTSSACTTNGYGLSVSKSNVTLSSGSEPTNICSNVSATYTAGAGYALPNSISVSGASSYTWLNGTLTINKANVTGNVSVTIAADCVAPNITTDPVSANYTQAEGTGTALSIVEEDATAAGATLSYQWQSTDDAEDWEDSDIEGATNATYAPSKATVGTKYYRVKVTSNCGETATSNAAAIAVSAPSVCVAPTFSPAAGTYTGTQSVEISSETDDATIYYTTDGTDPTNSGTRVEYAGAISVAQNMTLKAYAEKSGLVASGVTEGAYLIKCATPAFTPTAGTHTGTQSVTISCATDDATIYYTTDGTDPTNSGTRVEYAGAISVAQNMTLKAYAEKSGMENSAVAEGAYLIKCATPAFSPEGGTYTGTQSVTISCATDDATIYYTTDGSTPDNTKSVYSTPIAVSTNTTIKAIAVKEGLSESAIGSQTYSIKYTVTLNLGGGNGLDNNTGWTYDDVNKVYTKAQTSVGGSITLPDATLSSGLSTAGWSFAGWADAAVGSETSTAPNFKAASYTPNADVTLYAVYVLTEGGEATDVLDWAFTDCSTSYGSWIDKKGSESDAVYAGYSMTNANHDYIQLKSKDNVSGIVTTASGGNATKVTISCNSSTKNGRTLDVYGKSTAYSAASDLYNDDNKGTYIGSIVYGTSTELEIDDDYAFIGMRSNDGAMYLEEIQIEWSTASYTYFSNPSNEVSITYDANGGENAPDAQSGITIGSNPIVAAAGSMTKTGHTFSKWNTKADGTGTNYDAGGTITGISANMTLYAKWTKNNYTVAVASVDHTTITATPAGASAIEEGSSNTEVAYGTEVTLANTDDSHFTFNDWDVYETGNSTNKVTVSEGKFTVPAFNVTVSATNLTEADKRTVNFYSNGGEAIQTGDVYVGEVPSAPTAVYESCLGESNAFYGWATTEWDNTIDAEALAAKTVYTGDLPNVVAGEEAIEYYAVWAKGTDSSTDFVKLGENESSYLVQGAKIAIVNNKDDKILGNDFVVTAATHPESDDNKLTVSSSQIWTLAEQDEYNYWKLTCGDVQLGTNALANNDTKSEDIGNYSNDYSWWGLSSNTEWDNKVSGCYYMYNWYTSSGTAYYNFLEYNGSKWVSYYATNVTNGNKSYYAMKLYKPAQTYSEFRTNCCGLKPVTNLNATVKSATSVTLSWTAPESKTGITEFQVWDADDNVLMEGIDKDETSVDVEELTECQTYTLRVISYGAVCSVASSSVETTPSASTKTVTFNYNGGSGSVSSVSTVCGVATVALPTPNDRAGYNFKGWNDGTTTYAPSTATYTPADDITLTAQWAQLFTVSYNLAGATNIDAIAPATYEAGASVTLTDQVPNKGVMASFKAWSFSTEVTMTDATHFTMPSSNVTITATYNGVGEGSWILVEDASEVTVGSFIIIAAAGSEVAMSTTQNTSNRGQQAITKSGNVLIYETAPAIFEVKAGNKDNTVAFYDGAGYIYAASSSSNDLKTKNTLDNDGSWTVTINGNAEATVTAQGTNTHNLLKKNTNSALFSCYTSGQSAIALYKFYENVPTVTYHANSGSDEVTNLPNPSRSTWSDLNDRYEVTIAAGPSRYMYEFAGWYDNEEGEGDAYSGTIAIDDDIDLYAQWSPVPAHHITYVTSGSTGTTPTDATDYYSGDEVTLASASGLTNSGYFFDGWNVTYVDGESAVQTLTVEEGKFTMPNFDVTATATWAPKSDDKWTLVSSAGMLEVDGEYAIVCANADGGKYYAMSKTQNTNNRGVAKVEFDGDNLVGSSSMAIFTLKAGTEDNTWAFYDPANTGYIYAASSNKNYLQTQEENDANGSWTIELGENSIATITAQGTYTHNLLKYNSGSDIFSCYASGQQPVKLYKKKAVVRVENSENVNTEDISAGADVIVEAGGTLTVNVDKNINDLTVKAGGEVILSSNTLTVVGTFTIKTEMASGKSGQMNGATVDNFVAANAYIDITLGANGTNQQWHAFTVPFPVDVMNGIYDLDGNKLTNEVNYAIMEYLGDVRATGAYGWKKIRTTLVPGTFYIMATDGYRTTYRFKKKAGAALVAENSKHIFEYPLDGGTEADKDNGWNGLGNPNLFYGKVDLAVQVLDPESYTYVTKTANSTNFVVGTPFFYQAADEGTMVMETADASANYAPARVQANEIKDIPVSFGNEKFTDYLYVSANEDALNEYETGKDLAKMSMTNTPKVAQIFGKAYNTKLCMVHTPLVNDQAEVALELYAPKAGEYTIAADENANATVYLTYDDNIIWDLTMSAYTGNFAKGSNTGYGLLLQAKMPMTPTGVDNVHSDKVQCTKVILDEKVFILRGGQMYDVTGKAVK